MRRAGVSISIVVLLAALSVAIVHAAQGRPAPAEPHLEIVSPREDAYVSGTTMLSARVEPAGSASMVVFYVDGKQICVLTHAPFDCDWNAGPTVAEHQVRVVANLASGGRIAQTARTKGVAYAESVDVDVVQVTATVVDRKGHFVTGLPKNVFHVFEDGRPQAISHFASEHVPLELIVALDISGSMTTAMPNVKTAVKQFLTAVPSQASVTLLGFNDTIFALTRRTTDPAERARAVDRLMPWGSTALYDVIIRSTEMLGRETGRKSLIVFTDGEDQGSHAPIEEVERRLQASDVTLYMIGQGRGTSMDRLKKVMQRLAQPTGGRALFTEKIEELHNAFDELLDELSHQYLLGYAPETLHDDALHGIRVEVDGQQRVRARQSYRASVSPAK